MAELVQSVQDMLKEETWTRATISNYTQNNLKEFANIQKEVNMLIPKGASTSVDDVAIKIIKNFGFDKLNHIAKLNFKNTDKIKEKLKEI